MERTHVAIESDGCITIGRLFLQAGWDVEDKAQVSSEDPAADGRADYLLKDLPT